MAVPAEVLAAAGCTGRGWQPSLAARRSPRLLFHGRRSSHAVRRKTVDLLLPDSLLAYGCRCVWPLAVGGRLSTGHLSFVRSTRRRLPRSMPGQRPGTVVQSDGDRRAPSRSTDGSRYPRLLVPSGSRLGLRQHSLRGVQGGRRPPCSGCVVVSPYTRVETRKACLGAKSTRVVARMAHLEPSRTRHHPHISALICKRLVE